MAVLEVCHDLDELPCTLFNLISQVSLNHILISPSKIIGILEACPYQSTLAGVMRGFIRAQTAPVEGEVEQFIYSQQKSELTSINGEKEQGRQFSFAEGEH